MLKLAATLEALEQVDAIGLEKKRPKRGEMFHADKRASR
jgi:hypothetical protein